MHSFYGTINEIITTVTFTDQDVQNCLTWSLQFPKEKERPQTEKSKHPHPLFFIFFQQIKHLWHEIQRNLEQWYSTAFVILEQHFNVPTSKVIIENL